MVETFLWGNKLSFHKVCGAELRIAVSVWKIRNIPNIFFDKSPVFGIAFERYMLGECIQY